MESLTYAHNICTSSNPYKLYIQLTSLLYNGLSKKDNVKELYYIMYLFNHLDVRYYLQNKQNFDNIINKFCTEFCNLYSKYIKPSENKFYMISITIDLINFFNHCSEQDVDLTINHLLNLRLYHSHIT